MDGFIKRQSHIQPDTPHFSVLSSPEISVSGSNGYIHHGSFELIADPKDRPLATLYLSLRRCRPLFLSGTGLVLLISLVLFSSRSKSASLLLGSIAATTKSLTPWRSFGQLNSVVLHENGHVYVPASSLGTISGVEHPIHGLIRNASIAWERKLSRQSRTLEQAVTEYKRRYNRPPPRGFQHWYKFAKEQQVALIDEYDGINEDIVPFLALPPAVLQARMAAYAKEPNTHTLVIKPGQIDIASGNGPAGLARARDQRDMLAPCLPWLTETNATISPHDGPSVLMDEPHRRRHQEAGQRGENLADEYTNSVDDDPALWGFPLACAPGSRLRRSHDGLEVHALPEGASFIYDHVAAMDLCGNPEWQDLHGFTSWPGPRPSLLKPVFSMSRSTMHSDIRLTPLEQYRDTPENDPEWLNKDFDRAIWRGSTTGVWFDHVTRWRSSQRVRLYWLSQRPPGRRSVRFTEMRGGREVVIEKSVSLAELYQRYVDFGFVGEIVQCTEEDRGCEAVKKSIKLGKGMIWEEQNRLDIDGNAWSGRFHRLMSTNSLVLKATIFKEWYADHIQPWLHYVPVDVSYADLFDIMSFFSGDLEGGNAHEDLARSIATAGKEWTKRHWRLADMQAYTSRLLLEWARVTSSDRESMDMDFVIDV